MQRVLMQCYWMVHDHILVLTTLHVYYILYTLYTMSLFILFTLCLFDFYVCSFFVFNAHESSLRLAIISLVLSLLHYLINQRNKDSTLISMSRRTNTIVRVKFILCVKNKLINFKVLNKLRRY